MTPFDKDIAGDVRSMFQEPAFSEKAGVGNDENTVASVPKPHDETAIVGLCGRPPFGREKDFERGFPAKRDGLTAMHGPGPGTGGRQRLAECG